MKTRTFFLIATGVLVAATVLVLLVHFVLGLLVLRIAVGPTAETGRRSGFALAHVFSADHPRVRVSTVPVADLAASAGALDSGQVELAVVRSDLAPDTGQTVAILRRDAAFFLTSSASEIDDVSKLRGKAVGVLSTDGPTMKLLDIILQHYDIDPTSVHRVPLQLDQVADGFRHRTIFALFLLLPPNSRTIPTLLTAVRRSGHGKPQVVAVDEAAAIAKRYPLLETFEIPKGTFDGSLPLPDDDLTTLSVSYRLVARASMADWVAAEITRHVLTEKAKLVAMDETLVGIEAPDTEDKSSALPIHSGTAAYLNGTLESLSDQLQNALYWVGILTTTVVSLGALGAATYRKVRPRPPPSRVMRLLEIWLTLRNAEASDLDNLEREADSILENAVRAAARGEAEQAEVRLVSFLFPHVREAINARRHGPVRAG